MRALTDSSRSLSLMRSLPAPMICMRVPVPQASTARAGTRSGMSSASISSSLGIQPRLEVSPPAGTADCASWYRSQPVMMSVMILSPCGEFAMRPWISTWLPSASATRKKALFDQSPSGCRGMTGAMYCCPPGTTKHVPVFSLRAVKKPPSVPMSSSGVNGSSVTLIPKSRRTLSVMSTYGREASVPVTRRVPPSSVSGRAKSMPVMNCELTPPLMVYSPPLIRPEMVSSPLVPSLKETPCFSSSCWSGESGRFGSLPPRRNLIRLPPCRNRFHLLLFACPGIMLSGSAATMGSRNRSVEPDSRQSRVGISPAPSVSAAEKSVSRHSFVAAMSSESAGTSTHEGSPAR